MRKKNGARSHVFGIGFLYLMVHFPFLVFVKIGITGVGVTSRAKGIDREMPGFPIPVLAVPLPFAFQIEQALHHLLSPLNFRFYRGSGHTEWFLIPAAIPAVAVILGAWILYVCAIDWYFETHILQVIFEVLNRSVGYFTF